MLREGHARSRKFVVGYPFPMGLAKYLYDCRLKQQFFAVSHVFRVCTSRPSITYQGLYIFYMTI